MAKQKKEHTDWVITKGQLARWQKEQQRRKQIIIIVSAVIAVVLVLVIYAVIDIAVENDNPTVLKVRGPLGETSFDFDYYVDMLRLYGIQNVLPAEQGTRAQTTLNAIQTNEIYRQLAAELNISVSEEEIDKRVTKGMVMTSLSGTESLTNQATPPYEELIGDFAVSLDRLGITVQQYRDVAKGEILGLKVQRYVMEREVPEIVLQVHLQGIQFDISPPIIAGTSVDSSTPFQTATPQVSLGEPIDPMEIYDQVNSRLLSGEEFGVLAEEYAVFSGTGNLGWLPREIAVLFYGENVADAAFTLEPNVLSEPIPVNNSEDNTFYWLLRVLDKDERNLDEYHRVVMETQAFNDWYAAQEPRFSSEVKLDSDGIIDAITKALTGIKW